MASAVNSITTAPTALEAQSPLQTHTNRRLLRVAGVVAFALPFLLIGVLTQGFISSANINTLAHALTALDQVKAEAVIESYPPLATILAMAHPAPLTLMIVAALSTGATLWLLWLELRQTRQHPLVCALLIASLIVSPALTFLGTQSPAEMISLLLFVVAWRSYLDFMRTRATYSGFMAGLMLGLGFYTSLYAFILALLFALATPVFLQTNRKRLPETITAMAVVAFPALMAFLTWAYLNWIFTGSPLSFLASTTTPVALNFVAALQLTGRELLSLPLYIGVGVLVLFHHPRQLPVYLAPLLLIALMRTFGLIYTEAFAIALCSLIAFLTLPRTASPRWGVVLVCAAILQGVVGLTTPAYTPELRAWQNALIAGQSNLSPLSAPIAARLSAAPDKRILADSIDTYLVLGKTARPFVLPGDSAFTLALSNPAAYVDYLLIPQEKGDALYDRYGDDVPAEFVVEARWEHWTLYRKQTTAPVLSQN